MKKRHVLFAVVILLVLAGAFLLWQNSQKPDPHVLAEETKCTEVVVIPVFDRHGNIITTYISGEMKSHYEYDDSDQVFYRYPDNKAQWEEFYGPINQKISEANALLGKIYVDGGFIDGLTIEEQDVFYSNGAIGSSYDPDNVKCPENIDPSNHHWEDYEGIRINFYNPCEGQDLKDVYCTYINSSEKTTYVKVVSPAGSIVSYSHPTDWFNQILWYTFAGSGNFDFDPQFVAPDVLLDEQAYGESLLQTLVGGGNNQEIASFTLNNSDFEGRSELRSVIARAMEVAAVQTGHPVAMTLKGKMTNGQRTVANISAVQGAIRVNQWRSLFSSGQSTSIGESSLQMDYDSYFEDLTEGSIFILNP